MYKTLLLNMDYSPLRVISWQRAVMLWFDDKVEVLEEYEDFDLRSTSITIKCPAVIRLLSHVRTNRDKIKFSRINVFSRDRFSCSYCGESPGVRDLTYDHVIPRSRSGRTVWENIVTACISCNAKKGDRTPEEARMVLRSKPVKPTWQPYLRFTLTLPKTPYAWHNYLSLEKEIK